MQHNGQCLQRQFKINHSVILKCFAKTSVFTIIKLVTTGALLNTSVESTVARVFIITQVKKKQNMIL